MDKLSILIKTLLDGSDVDQQIKNLSSKIKERLVLKLKIDAADLEVLARETEKATKKVKKAMQGSVSSAETGKMYQQIEEQIKRINTELKKTGGQMTGWTANVNAKTKEITGATIQYADSLGRAKTAIYNINQEYDKIVDKKGQVVDVLQSVELEHTADKYSQSVSKQQTKNYQDAKKELEIINSLQIKKLSLTKDDVMLASIYDQQLTEHKNAYASILKSQVQISKDSQADAMTKDQLNELNKIRIRQEEKIAEILAKQTDIQARTTSTTTSGRRSLGEEVTTTLPFNFDASSDELNKYAEAVAGVGASFTKMTPKQDAFGNRIKEVSVRVKEGTDKWRNYTMTLDETTGKIYRVDRGLSDMTNRQLTAVEKFKTALQVYPIWLAATTITMQTIHAIQNAIKYIHEMDDAVTSLSKVVEYSNDQLKTMTQSAINLGKELGKSSVDIMSGMAEFGRVTKDMSEIVELTRVATMAANVTDLSIAEASKAITSSMINFQISAKESISILDQWNELQNNFRVSAEDLANSIGKVGSVARQSGTSIQQLEGYTTALTSSMGITGDEAGTALKSMMSRLFRLGSEGEEDAGKAEEYLKSIGIVVRDTTGNFRNFSDILQDTQFKFKDLNNVQQIALAQVIGGTHHYSKFIALMNAWDIATEATSKALNSQNSAIEENRKYLDSISGRIQILKTSWEDFTNSILSSDAFKTLVSGLGAIVSGLNTTAGKVALTVSTVTLLTMAIVTFKTQLIAAGVAVKGFFTSLGPIGWITLAVSALTPVVLAIANAFETASKKQKKALEELSVGYNEVKTKLIELQSELGRTIDRVDELNGKDKLTLIEEDELAKLQGVTMELQRQIDKETALKRLRGEALERATYDASQKATIASEYPFETLRESLGFNVDIFEKGTLLTVGQKLQEDMSVVDQYTRLLWQLKYQYDQGEISVEDFNKAESKLMQDRQPFIENLESMIQLLKEENDNYVDATEQGKKQKARNLELINSAEKLIINIADINTGLEGTQSGYEDISNPPAKETEDFSKILEDATKALDKYNQSIDRLQDAYDDLTDLADKMNAGTKLTGNEVIDLIQKYPGLITALEKTEEGYLINIDALDLLKQAQIDEMNLAQQAAINKQIAIVNSSSAIAESYGIQIAAIQSLADAEAQLQSSGLLLGLDPSKFDVASGTYNGRNIADLGLSEKGMELLYNKVNIAKAVMEIGKLKDQAKTLQAIVSDPNFSKGFSDFKDDANKTYTATADVFRQLNIELERVNQSLTENQRLIDMSEGEEQNRLIEERVKLYGQQRTALLNLQKEQEKQLALRKQELSSMGFKFSGNDITNYATRLPQLTDEAAKNAEKLIAEFDDLAQKSLPNTVNQLGEIAKSIKDIGDTASESVKKQIEETFGKYYDYLFDNIEKEIKLIQQSTDAYNEKADSIIKQLRDQIDLLEKVNEQEKEQEERAKRIADIEKQKQTIANLQNEKVRMFQNGEWVYVADPRKMREETEKLQEMQEDYASWEKDLNHKKQIEQLQQQISMVEQAKQIQNTANAERIAALQNFTDAQKEMLEGQKVFEITNMAELNNSLLGLDQSMYADRLTLLEQFLTDYNNLLGQSNTPFIANPTLGTQGFQGLNSSNFTNPVILSPVLPQFNIPKVAIPTTPGNAVQNHFHFNDLSITTPDAGNFIMQLEMIARSKK